MAEKQSCMGSLPAVAARRTAAAASAAHGEAAVAALHCCIHDGEPHGIALASTLGALDGLGFTEHDSLEGVLAFLANIFVDRHRNILADFGNRPEPRP